MPSFEIDDFPVLSLSVRNLSLEPLGELRQSHEKANGTTRSTQRSTKAGLNYSLEQPSDGCFIGSPRVNGDMQNDGNQGAIPNGRLSTSSWDNRSSRNGSALSVNGSSNGTNENGSKVHGSANGLQRSPLNDRGPVAITNGGPVQTVNGEASAKPLVNGNTSPTTQNNVAHHIPGNSQSTGRSILGDSSMKSGAGELLGPTKTPTSHRFSSPPAYPSSKAPNSAPTSATTSSPLPGPPPLKHRHTLQVPRAGTTGRSSRDGADDAAYTSGRFSPTATRRDTISLNRRTTRSMHSDMPHDEILQDEDAQRWAEVMRQRRASKRRRKDEEDEERVVVGTKVDMHHVNWVTAYNMLTGIRFTVSRTNAKMDRPLTDADFVARHKFSFDITGNELTPSAKYDFKFKDYAPWVFRRLRAHFKLDPADYLISLTSKYILSELGSPGKSGSFFYFSRDYKYIIKTIHHAEHKFLRKILKDYYNHVENNPNTLLSQFYGLHRVKIPYGRKIHFVVMNNLFPPHRDIHQTFDLKGSTVGRNFREQDLEKNPRATLKDLNFLNRRLHLEFGPEKKRLFIEQMERDVRLLQRLKIMDYSLLVGIHDLHKGNQENLRDKTLQVFHPGGENPEDVPGNPQALMRTPSKLENTRKARELREMIKQEKPIPMGLSTSRIDQMEENATKRDFVFYSEDGGFQATHEDNRPGDEIYYLGIIDCLTRYGTVKRLEHFWKGLSHDKQQISPVPSALYGDRFIKFISRVTKTREEAEREDVATEQEARNATFEGSIDAPRHRSESQTAQRTDTDSPVVHRAEGEGISSEKRGSSEEPAHDRTITTVRSPSAERGNERTGMTLPIVDEVGESSSTGDRSCMSGENTDDGGDAEDRPPTPPKDDEMGFVQRWQARNVHRGTAVDSNKALPPLPKVMSQPTANQREVGLS
ncbi:MAG: Phosphatidylinositol-4-phosphate 5-kinase [Claussenomyces sp. TS43310]|nr:MAG: Phosphatidylinositol-4-phosphate 5-kinase [Claussenomyces sp. TS43310]